MFKSEVLGGLVGAFRDVEIVASCGHRCRKTPYTSEFNDCPKCKRARRGVKKFAVQNKRNDG